MTHYYSLSRAARIVGISRGALQQRIKDGELTTFEGKVRLEDLLRLYPDTTIEDDKEIERVTNIKEHAFAKRMRDVSFPDAEVLAARLNEISKELINTRTRLEHRQKILNYINQQLIEIANGADSSIAGAVSELQSWLTTALAQSTKRSAEAIAMMAREKILHILTAHVHIQGSNNEFFVEGNDTILQAGIRGGCALNYRCNDGSCGVCRGKIISGKTKEVRSSKNQLTDEQIMQGEILLCCHTAVTDLVLDVSEAATAKAIPLQEMKATIKRIQTPKENIRILELKTPLSARLQFLAGQDVLLKVENGLSAVYSLASCPCDECTLQIHIYCRDDDEFSQYICQQDCVGKTLGLEGPRGDFVLNRESSNSMILISQGAGFATIKSIAEHAIAMDVAESIYMFRWGMEQGKPYLHNLCRAWDDALDNFHYRPAISEDSPAKQIYETSFSRLDKTRFDVYLVGNDDFIQNQIIALSDLGFNTGLIRSKLVD